MKATVYFYCAPMDEGGGYEAEDIRITVHLPFVPQPGMRLKVTPQGEHYQVDEVFWDVNTPDEVEVFLEEPDQREELQPWPAMQAEGWRIL